MITINLTPIEELENPYWWLPDLGAFLLVVGLSFGLSYFYIHSIETEINARELEKQRLISETEMLRSNVDRFNDLNQKISALNSKKNSLQRITESKLVRYLPIILLENIQNLRPDGVWFKSVNFVDRKATEAVAPLPTGVPSPATALPPAGSAKPVEDGKTYPLMIEIVGNARDNVLIAEFMMALKATQNQSFEKSDLRTQLFFSEVGISFSQVTTLAPERNLAPLANTESSPPTLVNFKLELNFRERAASNSESANFSQFIEDFKRDGQAVMN